MIKLKKIWDVFKIIIKLILIYFFLLAVSSLYFQKYPIEVDNEKFIERLKEKYENNRCSVIGMNKIEDNYLYLPSTNSFNIFNRSIKLKLYSEYNPSFDYICKNEMSIEELNFEIKNIRKNVNEKNN